MQAAPGPPSGGWLQAIGPDDRPIAKEFWRYAPIAPDGHAGNPKTLQYVAWFRIPAATVLALLPPPAEWVSPGGADDAHPPETRPTETSAQPVADEPPPAALPAPTEHQEVETAHSPGEAADARPETQAPPDPAPAKAGPQKRLFDEKATVLQLILRQKNDWKTRPKPKMVEDFLLAVPELVGDPPPRHDGREGFTRALIRKLIADRWGKGTRGPSSYR